MTDNKQKVAYIYGKFFDTTEEMMDYARKFPDMPLDLEWYREFLRHRWDEAVANRSGNPCFTNRMALWMLAEHSWGRKGDHDIRGIFSDWPTA